MADETRERLIRITVDASGAKAGAGEVERALNSIDDKLARLGDSVSGGFKKIGQGLAAYLSIDFITGQVKGLIDAFDRLESRAATLGTTTTWLQSFENAAASTSTKIIDAYGALEKFARVVGEAQLGSKGAVDTLDKLGVKIYDVDRNIRPLHDNFIDAAKGLTALQGTSLGAALGAQAMGKEYVKVAPMMGEIAKGAEAMAAATGKMVSPEKVQMWADLASHADKAMLKWRAFAGENFAEPVKAGFELMKGVGEGALKALKGVWDTLEGLSKAFTGLSVGENTKAMFEGLSNIIGEAVGRLSQFVGGVQGLADFLKGFARTQNVAAVQADELGPLQQDIGRLTQTRARLRADIKEKWDRSHPNTASYNDARAFETAINNSIVTIDEQIAAKQFAAEQAARRAINYGLGTPDVAPTVPGANEWLTVEQQKALARRRGGAGGAGTSGAYGATATGGGATDADREFKRVRALESEAIAQKRMAAAALEGAAAVNEQEAKWKALQQALEVYGDKVSATDPKVTKLAGSFLGLNKSIADDKALTQFRLQTGDIERGNDLLELRLDLLGAAPEVIARETARLQVRNEAAKLGLTLSQEDIGARGQAAEKQELLNQRIAAQQQSQQLWFEPFKQALRDIQTFGSQMWDSFLEKGEFTFQSVADFAKVTGRKIASELLSLATIRPVIGVTVSALSSAGIMPASYASQMGYGSFVSGGTGFSMPSMPGAGGFASGFLGDVGQWLNTPFTGPYAGISPAAMQGVPTLAPSTWNPSSWGITPLQGIGAAAGAGMGIYQLINSKSTASTIGGISSILGAGVSLIPGIGQIAGPAIALLGNLLPGLFGMGEGYKLPPLQGGNTGWGWDTENGGYALWNNTQNGGRPPGTYGDLPGAQQALYLLAGGVKDNTRIYGNAVWQNDREGQTTVYLLNPGADGGSTQWAQGSGDSTPWVKQAAAKSALLSMLGGGVDISDNLRKALGSFAQDGSKAGEPESIEQLTGIVSAVRAFDAALAGLGKTMTVAEQAIAEIDSRFASLYDTASRYDLPTAELDAQKNKERLAYATDFASAIQRQLLDYTDPKAGRLADLAKEKARLIENDTWLVNNVEGALSSIVEIEQLYSLKRQQVIEEGAEQTVDNLKELFGNATETLQGSLNRILYGDLGTQNPADMRSGLESRYQTLFGQALGGDLEARGAVGGAATDFLEVLHKQLGNTAGYFAYRDQIATNLIDIQRSNVEKAGLGADSTQVAELIAAIRVLVANLQKGDNAALTEALLALIDRLQLNVTHG